MMSCEDSPSIRLGTIEPKRNCGSWKAVASFEYASFVKVEDKVGLEEGENIIMARCENDFLIIPSDVLLEGVGHCLRGVPIDDGGIFVND